MMELLDFLSHDLYVICRSRVLVTGVPVQTFSPTKYFDGLPDSFLKHVVFSRKDQGGGDIQGLLVYTLITVVTIMNNILRSKTNDA